MATTYRVRNWAKHFESSETRRLKMLRWIPIPNSHDGKGFRRLMALPDAAEIFGAWVLILQVASRVPERGILEDEDGPLTVEDLSFKTGLKSSSFQKALKALSDKSIGWLEVISHPTIVGDAQQLSGTPNNSTPEWNGMEGKGSVAPLARPDPASPSEPASAASVLEIKGEARRREQKPANPDHPRFVAAFCDAWRERYGTDYPFGGAKDGAHVKTILGRVGTIERGLEVIRLYFADSDQFVVKDRHGLGLLVSQIRKYVPAEVHVKPKLASSRVDG